MPIRIDATPAAGSSPEDGAEADAPQGEFATRLARAQGLAPPGVGMPSGGPAVAPGGDFVGALLTQMKASCDLASEALSVSKTQFGQDMRASSVAEDKLTRELFKDNPFGMPNPQEEAQIIDSMETGDLASQSMKLLRLQFLMQRVSQRMMFASNKIKSDDNKDLIANIR